MINLAINAVVVVLVVLFLAVCAVVALLLYALLGAVLADGISRVLSLQNPLQWQHGVVFLLLVMSWVSSKKVLR